ncbi:MAG: glycoside hydrolase family protein [Thioalkalispiraceae bacterium]|jgi:GH24 family phage-related lysozyme (muramidase)
MTVLSASVGRGGRNNKTDTRRVQGLLNRYKIPGITKPLKITGVADSNTIRRIEAFQKKIVKMRTPDGRIDPDGRTIKKLLNRPGSKAASALKVSAKGVNLLKSIERLALKPYDDQNGREITRWVKGATIGYGHLISRNDWPNYKNGLNKTEAEALFKQDLEPFAEHVRNKVTANILQQEFDAMVILAFNIGKTAFASSSALKLINNPGANTSYASLEKAWLAWNKSQGKYSRGLANRRKAEWKIYTKGVYQRW